MRSLKLTASTVAIILLSGLAACATVTDAALAAGNMFGKPSESSLKSHTAQWLKNNGQLDVDPSTLQILNPHAPRMMEYTWTADAGANRLYVCDAYLNMKKLHITECRPKKSGT